MGRKKSNEDKLVRVYTDGSCLENPGPGGWGAIFALDEEIKKFGGSRQGTTNNQMELLAVAKALQIAQKGNLKQIEIISDSAYVVNAINQGWLFRWKMNGWETAQGGKVKNRDLWELILEKLNEFDKLKFTKVKGHTGDTFNEMVDRLAKSYAAEAGEKARLENSDLS